jgi:ATP-independent RNA helicase DbpA
MVGPDEKIPAFVPPGADGINLPENLELPDKPQWVTLCFGSGKKDKLNKIDIVGFLSHKGKLAKEDIGLVEVKDFISFAAIRRKKAKMTLPIIEVERIKGKKPRVEIV